MNEADHATKIRTLNDQFRRTGRGGRIMLTQGIQALGQKAVEEIIAKVRAFDQFNEGNERVAQRNLTPARSQNRT